MALAISPGLFARKPRTLNARTHADDLLVAIDGWLDSCKDRDIGMILKQVIFKWTPTVMPSGKDLTEPNVIELVNRFTSVIGNILSPSVVALVAAMLKLHGQPKKHCLYGELPAERLARQYADAMRLVMAKYRELQDFPRKLHYFRRKATVRQNELVESVLGRMPYEIESDDTSDAPALSERASSAESVGDILQELDLLIGFVLVSCTCPSSPLLFLELVLQSMCSSLRV